MCFSLWDHNDIYSSQSCSLWSAEAGLGLACELCCLSAISPSYKTPRSLIVFSFVYVGGGSNMWEVLFSLLTIKIFEYSLAVFSLPSLSPFVVIFPLLCLSKCDLWLLSEGPKLSYLLWENDSFSPSFSVSLKPKYFKDYHHVVPWVFIIFLPQILEH